MFVSEKIGDKYKEWRGGQIIKISAPTGSGKSHFIFYKLLPWAVKCNSKILYLVNRKVLKEQFEEELRGRVKVDLNRKFNCDIFNHIEIKTYQMMEREIIENNSELFYLNSYRYIVYDECHYFYSDSNFNTNTVVAYDFLKGIFSTEIQIFMSATMENMSPHIDERRIDFLDPLGVFHNQSLQNTCLEDEIIRYIPSNIIEYKIDPDYSFVKVKVFESEEILENLISKDKGSSDKWLIFVDRISDGEKLKNDFDKILKDETIFIDARYERDGDANESVMLLKEREYVNKKVLIATSVLDNGVSIKDRQLRNIVLFCDTREQFIQMLGRKRPDEQILNVYICKQTQQHFNNRYRQVKRNLDFYYNNEKIFKLIMERSVPDYRDLDQYKMPKFKLISQKRGEILDLIYREKRMYTLPVPNSDEVPRNPGTYIKSSKQLSYDYYASIEYEKVLYSQHKLLAKILNSRYSYEAAKELLFSCKGILAVNYFSLERSTYLAEYYKNMVEKLKKDEDAFLKEQVGWLGLDISIEEAKSESDDFHREELKNAIEEILDGKAEIVLSRDENLNFKGRNRDHFLYFSKSEEARGQNEKNDRTITPEVFNECMRNAGLPLYNMKKEGKSQFKILKL